MTASGKHAADEAVEVGTVFTVTRLRFNQGSIIATLTSNNTEVEAELS